jgi:hypothetical protein
MASGDVLMATIKQRYTSGGEIMLNNFFYQCDDALGTAVDLTDVLIDTLGLVPRINAIQCAIVINDSIRIINLYDLTDFNEVALLGAGALGGDCLPAHNAISYSLKLDTRAVRPGSKRFSGVPESAQANGIVTDSGYIANMELLRIKMAASLTVGGAGAYSPVVVRRNRHEPDETHEFVWYSLPEHSSEAVVGHILTSVVKTHISHQVSRGNGR